MQSGGSAMTVFFLYRSIRRAALLVILTTPCAYGQHGGNFKKDTCTKRGYRQYSAVLEGIPFGQSWEKACASKDATIAGHYFPKPDRCRNQGPGIAMWGEFDVPDNSCKAQWGSFQRGACTTIGKRKYSAQVLNVPPGQTWENACATTPANVQGQSFATPSKCSNTGVTGEWGEFDVNDNTCQAHWGNFQSKCTTTGKREYSAQLSVPDGLSWEATCAATSATVGGQSFRSPTRCEKRLAGVGGEWGIFDVNDAGCSSPTVLYIDGRGYRYVETSDSWKKMCTAFPCFGALQWPDYATKWFPATINGQPVVIQLWKGYCEKFLGLERFPGGIGAEVGIYRREPGRARPTSLPFLPPKLAAFFLKPIGSLTDNDLWWAYPELNTQLSFTLVNPITKETFFSTGTEKTYWLNRWMDESSYSKYKQSQGAGKTPTFSVDYRLEYTINGTRYSW